MPLFGQFFKAVIFKKAWRDIFEAMVKELIKPAKSKWKALGKKIAGKDVIKKLSAVGSTLKGIGTAALFPLNMFLSVLDAFGVAEPFLELFSMVLEIIGASLVTTLMPAFDKLVEIFTDPVIIDFLGDLGTILGIVLTPIVDGLTFAFGLLKDVIELFGTPLDVLKTAWENVSSWWEDLWSGELLKNTGIAIGNWWDDIWSGQLLSSKAKPVSEALQDAYNSWTQTGQIPNWVSASGMVDEMMALGAVAPPAGGPPAGTRGVAGKLGDIGIFDFPSININIEGNANLDTLEETMEELMYAAMYGLT